MSKGYGFYRPLFCKSVVIKDHWLRQWFFVTYIWSMERWSSVPLPLVHWSLITYVFVRIIATIAIPKVLVLETHPATHQSTCSSIHPHTHPLYHPYSSISSTHAPIHSLFYVGFFPRPCAQSTAYRSIPSLLEATDGSFVVHEVLYIQCLNDGWCPVSW